MFSKEKMIAFNYYDESEEPRTLYNFKNPLEQVPKFAVFNNDKSKFVVVGDRFDILYVDSNKRIEVDIFEKEEIGNV